MKIILILLDGLGDRSYRVLQDLTPLQAAFTPNLDRLAQIGSNGLFHASFLGQCLPSETAHYLLFGYNVEDFPGRGLLEAVGDNVPFDDQDVLCLSHLSGVTWQDDIPILIHSRKDIPGNAKEIGRIFNAISPYETHGIQFLLHQTRRNDAILVVKGEVSPYVSDSDPMTLGKPVAKIEPLADNPEPEKSGKTALAMNTYLSYCHRTLKDHSPANFLTTQRCGRRVEQRKFNDQWGLNGLLIASESIYIGLACELGLTAFRVKNSDDPAQDLRERIRLALEDNEHDYIHVHTKDIDEAAHSGDPEKKKNVISALDCGLDELLGVVESRNDLLVVVTADHSTPSISPLIHSGEPVPVILTGPNVRRDKVGVFDEISAAEGCLGLIRGQELMYMILNYSDRAVLHGHQMGTIKRPYFPDSYRPFKLI
jgi:2,3-bisphosphoglycerate-independent phosphoglycerate mutase